jgi:hypothetical protein
MEVKLATCRVPEDLASFAPLEGYVVAFTAFLRLGIQCAILLIPPLIAAALRPGATQYDPLGDLAHCGLRDSV